MKSYKHRIAYLERLLDKKNKKIATLNKKQNSKVQAKKVDPKPIKVHVHPTDSIKVEPKTLEKAKKHGLLYRIFHKKHK